MSARFPETADAVIPFPVGGHPDGLDRAGSAVLGMLRRAATAAEENTQSALALAHRLSMQLREAEDRIKELEADRMRQKDRADRAEQWLRQISTEIKQTFFASAPKLAGPVPNSARPTKPEDYAPKSRGGR